MQVFTKISNCYDPPWIHVYKRVRSFVRSFVHSFIYVEEIKIQAYRTLLKEPIRLECLHLFGTLTWFFIRGVLVHGHCGVPHHVTHDRTPVRKGQEFTGVLANLYHWYAGEKWTGQSLHNCRT